jgi:hypothetical protein
MENLLEAKGDVLTAWEMYFQKNSSKITYKLQVRSKKYGNVKGTLTLLPEKIQVYPDGKKDLVSRPLLLLSYAWEGEIEVGSYSSDAKTTLAAAVYKKDANTGKFFDELTDFPAFHTFLRVTGLQGDVYRAEEVDGKLYFYIAILLKRDSLNYPPANENIGRVNEARGGVVEAWAQYLGKKYTGFSLKFNEVFGAGEDRFQVTGDINFKDVTVPYPNRIFVNFRLSVRNIYYGKYAVNAYPNSARWKMAFLTFYNTNSPLERLEKRLFKYDVTSGIRYLTYTMEDDGNVVFTVEINMNEDIQKNRYPEGMKESQAIEFLIQEGKKLDNLVRKIKQEYVDKGYDPEEAESIAWATVNKMGMLKNKNFDDKYAVMHQKEAVEYLRLLSVNEARGGVEEAWKAYFTREFTKYSYPVEIRDNRDGLSIYSFTAEGRMVCDTSRITIESFQHEGYFIIPFIFVGKVDGKPFSSKTGDVEIGESLVGMGVGMMAKEMRNNYFLRRQGLSAIVKPSYVPEYGYPAALLIINTSEKLDGNIYPPGMNESAVQEARGGVKEAWREVLTRDMKKFSFPVSGEVRFAPGPGGLAGTAEGNIICDMSTVAIEDDYEGIPAFRAMLVFDGKVTPKNNSKMSHEGMLEVLFSQHYSAIKESLRKLPAIKILFKRDFEINAVQSSVNLFYKTATNYCRKVTTKLPQIADVCIYVNTVIENNIYPEGVSEDVKSPLNQLEESIRFRGL